MSSVKSPEERWLTAEQVADLLQMDVQVIRRKAARGQIPGAAKVGRVWRFNEAVLRQWLASGGDAHRRATQDEGETGAAAG